MWERDEGTVWSIGHACSDGHRTNQSCGGHYSCCEVHIPCTLCRARKSGQAWTSAEGGSSAQFYDTLQCTVSGGRVFGYTQWHVASHWHTSTGWPEGIFEERCQGGAEWDGYAQTMCRTAAGKKAINTLSCQSVWYSYISTHRHVSQCDVPTYQHIVMLVSVIFLHINTLSCQSVWYSYISTTTRRVCIPHLSYRIFSMLTWIIVVSFFLGIHMTSVVSSITFQVLLWVFQFAFDVIT